MRKWLVALAAILALVGGWWYASPLWTLREMRQAAMERDADRFSSYIDYPAVRDSLKAEIRKSVMQDMSAQSSRGASIGSAFALALLGPLVDAMITPDTVQTMFAKQPPVANPPRPSRSFRPQRTIRSSSATASTSSGFVTGIRRRAPSSSTALGSGGRWSASISRSRSMARDLIPPAQ
jgi:hypothetical protein